MKPITSEKVLERKLCEGVKKAGGLALKWVSPGFTGVPDRIVIMPGERIFFVEMKSSGKELEPRQRVVQNQLWKLGCDVWTIDNEITLTNFLKAL